MHLGYADQAADPFIASAEGGQATPAYRGCAYAVFENMALAPFGNRIPSLTFEVEADAGPLAVGAILEELSDGLVQGETPEEVRGFAASRTVDRDGVRLDLKRITTGSMAVLAAEPGRNLPAPDHFHGPTIVHLLDLPNLTDTAPASPRLYVAAAGTSPGWRRASLLVSLDEGGSWTSIGTTAEPAIMGEATTPLGTASEMLFDSNNAVTVDLLHHQMLLEDADDMRLLAGDNLALLGEELIQYGRAEPLGGALWRLSRLVRGRRGTGWASDLHHVGERFVLIEAAALAAYDAPGSAAGTIVELLASGIGDPVPAAAGASAIGQALRPPAPVHLAVRSRADGGFDLAWVRRSRTGWIWIDGVDAPLGEELEAYRLTIVPGNGSLRSYEVAGSTYLYPASDASGDRAVGPEVTVSVVQIGTSASSRPAVIVLTL